MAKKRTLTDLQLEYGRELRNLRRRWKAAIKAGFLNERVGRKIPARITEEYVREHASRREIEFLKGLKVEKIRTPKAEELYREVVQNTTPQSLPARRKTASDFIDPLPGGLGGIRSDFIDPLPAGLGGVRFSQDTVGRREIIHSYINALFDYIDKRESEHPEGKQLSEANEYRRVSNVRRVRNIFEQAIAHYGEDEVNEFLADSNNMYELNTLIDKIAALYLERDQAQADVLIVEFATMFNGGPLTESQMQDLEESGAFDFYEDDLI